MTMVPPSISRGLIVQKGLVPECKVQLNFVIFIPQCHPYQCRGWRLFVRPCVSIPWVWMRASTRSRGISYSNVMFRSGDNRAVGSWRNAVNEHFVYRKLFATCRTTSLFTVYHIRCIWYRHQMETFSTLLAICAGNSPVTGEFPAQRPVTRSFDVFFDLRLNKRLSKQWWGWWFETPSRPLWRHCN